MAAVTDSLLELNLNKDVSTDKYIKEREDDGTPALVGSLAEDGLTINSKYWLLQHVDGSVPGASLAAGGTVDVQDEFILADPKDVFAEFTGEIGDVINKLELNSLLDVKTKLGDAYLPHKAKGDTFLLCVREANNSGVIPEYQPRSLSETFDDLVESGAIEINVDDLANVNNIYVQVNPGTPADGVKETGIRLKVTDDYKKGLSTALKYEALESKEEFDDILVYLKGDGNDSVKDISALSLFDKDGTQLNRLPEGWYYAENNSEGAGKLEEAGLVEPEKVGNEETPNKHVKLGGVRILKYKDTNLVPDPDNGGMKVGSLGADRIPTNIGITSDGVLYSTVPSTLTFGQAIDIVGDVSDVDPTLDGVATVDKTFFGYTDDANKGDGVVTRSGPGARLTPGTWDPQTPASLPSVGDFYVIRFTPRIDTDGNTQLETQSLTATLKWNDSYPSSATGPDGSQNGPDLQVENGDLVAFGPQGWSIIGSVNTETIAQDLQDVTERGNFTDQGILLKETSGSKGLLVGTPTNREDLTVRTSVPEAGIVSTQSLETNHINFNFIPELT